MVPADDLPTQRQAQALSSEGARGRTVDLVEAFEDPRQFLLGDPDAGVLDDEEGRASFRAEFDDETESWVTFIHAWWEKHGQHSVRVGDLLVIYEKGDDFLGIGTYNRNEKGRETALGRRLASRRNAIYGGYRIDNPGKQQGGNLWRLVPTEPKE